MHPAVPLARLLGVLIFILPFTPTAQADPPSGTFGDDFARYAPGAAPSGFVAAATTNASQGGAGSWAIAASGTANVYEALLANAPGNGNGAGSTIRGVPYLGGGANRSFVYSSNIKLVSAPAAYNIGLVALSGHQPIYAHSFYFAGMDQAGHLFIKSINGGASDLTPGAAVDLPGGVVKDATYTFTLAATYKSPALTLELTITDGAHTGSVTATAASPLAGNACGYLGTVATVGGSLKVDVDHFRIDVPMGKWSQTLDDEFDGVSLNTKIWSTGYRWTGVINNELEAMRPENVTVANGVCTIKAEKRPAMNANMANYAPDARMSDAAGCIQTYNKWSQCYGYFEAKIKMPSAAGTWPAFWMLPDRGPSSANLDQRVTVGDSVRHVPVPMGNEIDIVEYQAVWENPSTGNSASHSGYIWKYAHGGIAADFVNANDGTGPRLALSHPDTEFHTYGVHWMPNCIVWYLDGKAVFYQASQKYVSVVPEYLILNCALTQQNWLGEPLGLDRIDAALPGNMVIDYVRAWSEK